MSSIALTHFYLPLHPGRGGKAERHIPHHLEKATTACHQIQGDGKLVLAGKSMGSRVGVHVAAENVGLAAAVICFGYPLKVTSLSRFGPFSHG